MDNEKYDCRSWFKGIIFRKCQVKKPDLWKKKLNEIREKIIIMWNMHISCSYNNITIY